MKKIIALIIILSAFNISHAQHICCAMGGSSGKFAMLIQDQHFVDTHLNLNSFILKNKIGKEISFKTTDGKLGYAYEIKSASANNNYIFVIHEWWGLNDYIMQESEKIHNSLGNVLWCTRRKYE